MNIAKVLMTALLFVLGAVSIIEVGVAAPQEYRRYSTGSHQDFQNVLDAQQRELGASRRARQYSAA